MRGGRGREEARVGGWEEKWQDGVGRGEGEKRRADWGGELGQVSGGCVMGNEGRVRLEPGGMIYICRFLGNGLGSNCLLAPLHLGLFSFFS